MKKTALAVFCALGSSLSCSIALAADDGSQSNEALQINADKLIAPLMLDSQAEQAAQSRMDDAMARVNEKMNKQFEMRFNEQLASVDR